MMRLRALALNTFREAVRDRVLIAIVFFAILVLVMSRAIEDITIGDQEQVVRSVAQGAIDIFGALVAMFLGISIVWKEIERRTVYTILSKPIPRWMFVLGKYLGLLLTVVVEVAVMGVIYTVLMTIEQHFPPPVLFVSLGTLLFNLALLTAWATLFSTWTTPTTAAAFALAVFVIGHLADDIWLYGSKARSEVVREVAHVLYWLLPNFELFNLREAAVHERTVPWERVWPALGYGITYTTAVLGTAVAIFQRKDIR